MLQLRCDCRCCKKKTNHAIVPLDVGIDFNVVQCLTCGVIGVAAVIESEAIEVDDE
jgi:hypothetical protein